MRKIVSIFVYLYLMNSISAQYNFNPPATPTKIVKDTLHGEVLEDPYRWLEDKKAEEVIAWTKAQHETTLKFIEEHCPPLNGLREEIKAYIDRDIISPMSLRADRQFFTVKKKGDQQPKLYTKIGEEEILLFDPVSIDATGKSAMTGTSYTKKADRVAVGLQNKGAEISTYYIIDTKTGKQLGAPIVGLRGFSWTADEEHAYIWVRTQEMIDNQEAYKVYLHKIGSPRNEDQLLMQPSDSKNIGYISDERYAPVSFRYEGDFYATHYLGIRPTGSTDDFKLIYSSKEFRVSPEALEDKLYIYTNDHAPNFKLMVTDINQPDSENWKELIPEGKTPMDGYSVTPQYILVRDKKDAVGRIQLYDLKGNFLKTLQLPELGNVAFASYNRDVDAVFVGFSTFDKPYKIYKLDPHMLASDDLEWNLYYEQEVPVNTENIEAKIDFYTSEDGTKVPLFIIHRKDLKKDGNNPTLLYGYGGFNVGMSPNFIGAMSMFVNRGGVYAIACLRGGDEYGESWHQDGMLHKKQNTFDDAIAAAEYLIAEGYTSNQKLAIRGGSNGGLLVGAVVTQRPDLFKTAICAVPLLDMIRFHKFLIARYWIPEYGDPDKKEDYEYIKTYSPYHNIQSGVNHPTMMVTAGENDSRVDPLHAKKMVAAMQSNPGQKNPILLYMDYDSGHGSGKSTEQTIKEMEDWMRFLMRELGME